MANSPAQLCAQSPVSEPLESDLHVLEYQNAAELEAHIAHCGAQIMAAYAAYEATSCFDALGKAHACRIAMERAIGLRSPAHVKQLEIERGLS